MDVETKPFFCVGVRGRVKGKRKAALLLVQGMMVTMVFATEATTTAERHFARVCQAPEYEQSKYHRASYGLEIIFVQTFC